MKSFSILIIFFGIFCINNVLYSQNAWNDFIGIYRKFGSPLVGGNCRMYPSCSKYADYQFKNYGFIRGFINTSDRLLRCSHDISYYPIIKVKSGYNFIDFGNDSLNKEFSEKWNFQIYSFNDYNKNNDNDFIKYLINNEQYESALLEINRQLFDSNFNDSNIELFVNYFRVLRKLNKQESIQYIYETRLNETIKKRPEILFELASSWMELENNKKSISIFNSIVEKSNIKSLIAQQSILNLVYLNSISENLDTAKELNRLIDSEGYFKNQKIKNSQTLSTIEELKFKNKKISTILGLIPGGGYLYAGHPRSAFSSLVVNSILSFATVSTFKGGNKGLGFLMGFTTLSFYLGNIKGGVDAVERYNLNKKSVHFDNLKLNFSL